MLSLPRTLRLTPQQFAEVCAANTEAVLELAADGQLIERSPTGGDTSARNLTLGALLWQAVRRSGLPLKVFDSSGGFLLLDGSVRSPDASLVRLERWQALSEVERRGFLSADNEVGRSATSSLAGWVSAGHPGADAQGPGDAGTTDEPPTQPVHGETTRWQQPGGCCCSGGHLGAQCPPD
jgi:hypothetical protein